MVAQLELSVCSSIDVCIDACPRAWERAADDVSDLNSSPQLFWGCGDCSIEWAVLVKAERAERCNTDELVSGGMLLFSFWAVGLDEFCDFGECLGGVLIGDSTFSGDDGEVGDVVGVVEDGLSYGYVVVGASQFDAYVGRG